MQIHYHKIVESRKPDFAANPDLRSGYPNPGFPDFKSGFIIFICVPEIIIAILLKRHFSINQNLMYLNGR